MTHAPHEPPPPEVYTLDEIARAAYVDRAAVEALVALGRLRFLPSTRLVAEANAREAAVALRQAALLSTATADRMLFATGTTAAMPGPTAGWSLALHGLAAIAVIGWAGHAPAATAPVAASAPSHLVFLVRPGPGGGGGGGGARDTPPDTLTSPTPEPVRPEAHPQMAPVAPSPAPAAFRDDAIEAAARSDSHGPGVNGDGTGAGGGNGSGDGAGIGDGEDGGAGGGVYRPGSGVAPPRLVREVKAAYSEDARRLGITGEVLMEIVVRADGSVGRVRVLRGLGHGLDERAAAATRQWRFLPATRLGSAVDVAVEVAVEFTLR